jgi:hypothetical protein
MALPRLLFLFFFALPSCRQGAMRRLSPIDMIIIM